MRLVACLLALVFAVPSFSRELLPLSDQLGRTKLRMMKNLSKQDKATLDRSIADLKKDGIEGRAPKKGDELPDFTLPKATGGEVKLSELVKNGPVVVTFYRGSWCPYCNVQLGDYQKHLKEITDAGGQIIALTPEEPEQTKAFAEKKGITIPIAWDKDNAYATQLKIVYGLPEDVKKVHQSLGIDLNKSQANGDWKLPVPATFVVNKDRKITFAYVDADFSHRAETRDLVQAVKDSK